MNGRDMEQDSLFKSDLPKEEREHLSRQLIRLGDMIGDGCHLEPDGKWIEREYRQVMYQLYPEIAKKRNAERVAKINARVSKMVAANPCKCGGTFIQSRSGALTCKCPKCGERVKIVSKKVKK